MTYQFTQDHKDWLQLLVNLLPAGNGKTNAQDWLNAQTVPGTIGDSKLDEGLSKFDGTQYYTQGQAFVAWVKGGVRPDDPH